MPRKVLVTGGAGFIGSHLVRALLARGDAVRVVDDFSTGNRRNLADLAELEVVDADLTSAPLGTAVEGVDTIYHLAAVPSVPRSVRDPLRSHEAAATATLRLLIAARDAGVRAFVNSSSSSVYGDVATPPMRETMPTVPRSPYAVAKLAAEGYVRVFSGLYSMSTVSLRYFNVFGPRQDPSSPYSAVIPRFVSAYLRGTEPVIYGDGRQSRDFTFVENVVRANVLAGSRDGLVGQSVNVAAGQPHSLLELLDMIAARFGRRIEPRFEPARPGDIRDSHADTSLAATLFGYETSITMADGLRRTIDWLKENEGSAS